MDAKDFGQLLKDHPEMLDDPKKFAAILRDIYPREKGNVNLIITACNAGVVSMLRKSALDDLLIARIMNVLMNDYGIAEEKARWTAELWNDGYSFLKTGKFPVRSIPVTTSSVVAFVQETAEAALHPTQLHLVSPTVPASGQESSPDWFNVLETDLSCTISKYIGPETEYVVIPKKINGKPVTEIGIRAFDKCTGLINVTIPNSVIKIASEAFRFCMGLSNVTIPESITEIGDGAFSSCGSLTDVIIPKGVTEISAYTFSVCKNLVSVVIPDSVTKIASFAFVGCTSLTNIIIPKSVIKINFCTFFRCTNLTSVTVLGSNTEIGNDAFAKCGDLTIHACAGSYAERYAKENNISFCAI